MLLGNSKGHVPFVCEADMYCIERDKNIPSKYQFFTDWYISESDKYDHMDGDSDSFVSGPSSGKKNKFGHFCGCFTADSQTDTGKHQLYNKVIFSTALYNFDITL